MPPARAARSSSKVRTPDGAGVVGSPPGESSTTIRAGRIRAAGLIHRSRLEVKLLAEGTPPAGLKVKVHRASAAATAKIEAAGGSVELIK